MLCHLEFRVEISRDVQRFPPISVGETLLIKSDAQTWRLTFETCCFS
jgi:hypothetical protein